MFLTSALAVVLGAVIQNSSFSIAGVKPNFVLVILVAFGLLEKDWLKRAVLVLLSGVVLIIEPYLGFQTLLVMSIFFFALALIDFLPWHELANASLALTTATLLIDLSGFRFGIFAIELTYNLALLGLGILLFTLSGVKYSR